jgi:predicted DsbA family dithiol-disulfide isomerase
MTARLPDSLDAFMAHARMVAAHAADRGTWQLYERLQRQYKAQFPDASNVEYEQAMWRIAKLTGI